MPGTESRRAAAPAAAVTGTAARHAGSRPDRAAVQAPTAISATSTAAGASTYSSILLGMIW